jgi:hypothetical protein
MPKAPAHPAYEEQLQRVRRICSALPGVTERLSHGEPTFFVAKKVFCMLDNNHHNDGHIAVWIPVAPGMQATLLKNWPQTFFYPPYVGVKGWVGIELEQIGDDDLGAHLSDAWRMVGHGKKRQSSGL